MAGDATSPMPSTIVNPVDPADILAGYANPANYTMPGDASPAATGSAAAPPTSTSTKLAIALGLGALALAALVIFAPPRGRALEE